MRVGFGQPGSLIGASLLLSLALAACGAAEPARPVAGTAMLEGDTALIAAAQTVSDTLGGCAKPAGAAIESKVVSLESSAIVMLACGADTHRLFSIKAGAKPELLYIADYDAGGWYGTDQAS